MKEPFTPYLLNLMQLFHHRFLCKQEDEKSIEYLHNRGFHLNSYCCEKEGWNICIAVKGE